MQPSECCIFRIVLASAVGLAITTLLLWKYSPVLAIVSAPVGGSMAAIVAMIVFQAARPFVSSEPMGVNPHSDYFARKIDFL